MTNDRVGPCVRAYTTTSDDDCRRYQGVFGPPEYYTQHDTIYRGRRRKGKRIDALNYNKNLIHGKKQQQQKNHRLLLLLLLLLLMMMMMMLMLLLLLLLWW